MPEESPKPTNIRAMQRRHERQLALMVMAFLVIIGGGLIALIYGPVSILTAVPCLLVGAGAIGLLFLLLEVLERWAANNE
jgi:hypothetical protein